MTVQASPCVPESSLETVLQLAIIAVLLPFGMPGFVMMPATGSYLCVLPTSVGRWWPLYQWVCGIEMYWNGSVAPLRRCRLCSPPPTCSPTTTECSSAIGKKTVSGTLMILFSALTLSTRGSRCMAGSRPNR